MIRHGGIALRHVPRGLAFAPRASLHLVFASIIITRQMPDVSDILRALNADVFVL